MNIMYFQLDDSVTFKPFISVLLNITPDHLDSYNYQFENYIASKFRIVKNQGAGDYFIYNADDAVIEQELIKPNYHKTITSLSAISFTLNDRSGEGGWISGDTLNIQLNQNQFNMTINELALQGKHNQYNSMAAAITGKALDIKKSDGFSRPRTSPRICRKSARHFFCQRFQSNKCQQHMVRIGKSEQSSYLDSWRN